MKELYICHVRSYIKFSEKGCFFHSKGYGSPELENIDPEIKVTSVAADGLSLRLKLTPLTKGHVHELDASGLRSTKGLNLLHDTAYYTLNEIPK